MKKKIIIILVIYMILASISLFNIFTPFSNDTIMYQSQDEYMTELKNAIENEDYELISNLLFSIAHSDYYETIVDDVNESIYNSNANDTNEDMLYNGLITLLTYIDISGQDTLEIKQIDFNSLNNNYVYFEYEENDRAGYFVNSIVQGQDDINTLANSLDIYSDMSDCREHSGRDFCQDYIYLDLENEIYVQKYIPDDFYTDFDYTIVMQDYKNVYQDPIVEYGATKNADCFFNNIDVIETIVNSDTSLSEREELQTALAEQANGLYYYGDTDEESYYGIDESINNQVYRTYQKVVETDDYVKLMSSGNYQDGHILDTNTLINNYYDYSYMLSKLSNAIGDGVCIEN